MKKASKILSWVFSIFLLLSGFCYLFSAPVGGIFFMLAGLILLPPLYAKVKELLRDKIKFNVRTWQKGSVIAVCIIIAMISLPTSGTKGNANTNVKTTNAAQASSKTTNNKLTVDYIDVGQGDSELIQQGDQDMLIDTGTAASQAALMSYVKPKIHGNLEYLVLTHPHDDHIGGAAEIINNFKVDNLYMSNAVTTTPTYENLLNTMKAKNLSYTQPALGSTFSLGSASCVVYGPVNADQKDLNTCSIVIKLTFGNTKFLFTGDSQVSNESAMISKGYDLSADVLKVGHHGSDTSTSLAFLNLVKPKYAMIEVGKGNDYGHPKQDILDRLSSVSAKVYRTDLDGTIEVTSDGKTVTFDKKQSANELKGASGKVQSTAPSSKTPSKVSPAPAPAPAPASTAPVIVSNDTSSGEVTVYWTPKSKDYYYNRGDKHLARSKEIISGPESQAKSLGKVPYTGN